MIHEAYMPVYMGSRFSLRTGGRAGGRAGPPEVVQEALADLKKWQLWGMSLAGQYWFSIVSILAWWQVTILNISTGLWWFADRIRDSCELAHWFGFVYIVYIIFCQTSVSTFCRTRMSWAFPRGHDCFKNSYQNLNYPFIAAAHHCTVASFNIHLITSFIGTQTQSGKLFVDDHF